MPARTVESLADLLWGVDRLVQDNAGSRVVSVDDPRERRLGFTVTWGGSEGETLWIGLYTAKETFDDCAMKLDCVLLTGQKARGVVKLLQTASGRQRLAELLQAGLIGPPPRPAARVPSPTQWDRLLED